MEMEKFSIALEKMINFELDAIFWSNAMDLIAMVTKSNTLEVFRMNIYKFKNQKNDKIILTIFRSTGSVINPKKFSILKKNFHLQQQLSVLMVK